MSSDKEQPYQAGEYLDFNINSWVPKIVMGSINGSKYKLKDPRIFHQAFDVVEQSSPLIKPFRTATVFRVNIARVLLFKTDLRLDHSLIADRVQELECFTKELTNKSARELIQYLRGKHYFFMDYITSAHYQIQSNYQLIQRYLQGHLQLFLKYLPLIHYRKVNSLGIYSSPMAALCSSFLEMLHFTVFASGCSDLTNSEGHEIRQWYHTPNFVDSKTLWINNQFLQTLQHCNYKNFSIDFILELLRVLRVFIVKKKLNITPKFINILQKLYICGMRKFKNSKGIQLKLSVYVKMVQILFQYLYIQDREKQEKLNSPQQLKCQQRQEKINSFSKKMSEIVASGFKMKLQENSDQKSEKRIQNTSQKKQNKMIIQVELTDNSQRQDDLQQEYNKKLQTIDFSLMTASITKQEFITCKNILLSCYLLDIYKSYKLETPFGIEFQRIVHQLKASLPKQAQNGFYKHFIKQVIQYFQQNELIEWSFENLPYFQPQQVSELIEVFPEIVSYMLGKKKFKILSKLLNLANPNIDDLLKMTYFINTLDATQQNAGQQLLDFIIELQKLVKSLTGNKETSAYLQRIRSKILNKLYGLVVFSKRNNQLYESILSSNGDPLKQKIWLDFMSDFIEKKIQNISIFHEYSLLFYANKSVIKLELFEYLCKSIFSGNLLLQQKEVRKSIVIHALHYIYRNHSDSYLNYLKIFIEYYTSQQSRNSQLQWINMHFFPADESLPLFHTMNIPEDQCQQLLQRLFPLRFQGDISLCFYLIYKINVMKGFICIDTQDGVSKLLSTPLHIDILYRSLYLELNQQRRALVQLFIMKFYEIAQDLIYSFMLVHLLSEIIINKAISQHVNYFFTKLKCRTIGSYQLSSNVTNKNDKKVSTTIHFLSFDQKQDVIQDETFQGQIRRYERSLQNCTLQIDDSESLINVIYRLSEIYNCQPQQINLIKVQEVITEIEENGQNIVEMNANWIIVNLQKYRNSQQKFIKYFSQQSIEQESSQMSIKLSISRSSSPLYQYIVDNFQKIIQCLPAANDLLEGYDFLKEEWKSNQSFNFLEQQFTHVIQGKQMSQIYYTSDIIANLLIDYCYYKLQGQTYYELAFLINLIKFINNKQTILRNAKIIYLIDKHICTQRKNASCFSRIERQSLIKCLLPYDQSERKRLMESFLEEKIYMVMKDKVYAMIQQEESAFQTFTLIPFHSIIKNYPDFEKQYVQKWQESYNSSIKEYKLHVFTHMSQNLINFHEDFIQMISILPWNQLQDEISLSKQVIAILMNSLVQYTKLGITYSQQKSISTLVIMINGIINKQIIQVVGEQWMQLKDYIKGNFYDFQMHVQQGFIKIISMIAIYSPKHSDHEDFLCFFVQQILETSWIKKRQINEYVEYQRDSKMQLQDRVGLKNPHSICFANSFLQQLYHLSLFRKQILTIKYQENEKKTQDLLYQLKKIFLHLQYGRHAYYNPIFFRAFKDYSGNGLPIDVQMDVDEFRNILFDKLQSMIPSENNFIKNMFNGRQNSKIRSQQCDHVSSKEEQFNSLCIEIKEKSSLKQSLDSYFHTEVLQKQNAYFCDQCGKKVKAEKNIEISHLPEYLTFVLKRFQYKGYRRQKINTYFQFPINQSFTYFVGFEFDLKGIIVHHGYPEAGHYISYIKYNKVWYEFNDSYVHQITEAQLIASSYGKPQAESNRQYRYESSKNAYLLIYEKKKQAQQQKMKEDYPYFGIEQQRKNIIQLKNMLKKEKVYFNKRFGRQIIEIAEICNTKSSTLLLFYYLPIIYIKILHKNILDDLKRPLMILKKNKDQLMQIWSQDHLKWIIKILKSPIILTYKSIIIDILVSNCHRYDEQVQSLMKEFLSHLYQEHEVSVCYMILYAFAAKFQQSCFFLHQHMIILRTFDLSFHGFVMQELKQALKETADIPYEPVNVDEQSQAHKHVVDLQFLYYKWSLLALILQKNISNLHKEEEKMLFQSIPRTLIKMIFSEAKNKPTTKYISKFLCLLVSINHVFFNKLMGYIGDAFMIYKSEFLKIFFKVIKDICLIQNGFNQRSRAVISIFQKMLLSFRDNSKDFSYLYTLLWLNKIMKTNASFRNSIRAYKQIFSFMQLVTPKILFFHRKLDQDQAFKYEKSFHPLYGIVLPTTFVDLQILFQSITQEIQEIFASEACQIERNIKDDDGDIINEDLQDKESLVIYDKNLLRYYNATVQFVFGDYIYLTIQKNIKNVESTDDSYFIHKGNEIIRRKTNQIYSNQIITSPQKTITMESQNPSYSKSTDKQKEGFNNRSIFKSQKEKEMRQNL